MNKEILDKLDIIAEALQKLTAIILAQRQAAPVKPTLQTAENKNYRCPKCNGDMVLKNNRLTGDAFFGCVRYPECTGTRSATGQAAYSKSVVTYNAEAEAEAYDTCSDHPF